MQIMNDVRIHKHTHAHAYFSCNSSFIVMQEKFCFFLFRYPSESTSPGIFITVFPKELSKKLILSKDMITKKKKKNEIEIFI